jgi:hypothetical protein
VGGNHRDSALIQGATLANCLTILLTSVVA